MFNYQQQQHPHGESSNRAEMFVPQAPANSRHQVNHNYFQYASPQWCQTSSPPSTAASSRRAEMVTMAAAKPTVIPNKNSLGSTRASEWKNDGSDPFNPKDPDSPTLSFSNQIEQLLRYKCNSSATLDYGQPIDNNDWWMLQQQQNPHPPPGLGHRPPAVIRNVPTVRPQVTIPRNGSSAYISPGSLRRSLRRDGPTSSTTILMPASDLSTHNTYNHQHKLTRRHFQAIEQPSWPPPQSRNMSQPTYPGRMLVAANSSGHSSSPFMISSTAHVQPSNNGTANAVSYNNEHHQYWLGSPHYFYQQRRSSLSQSTEDLLDPFGGKKKKTVVEQIADRVMKRLLRLVCEEVDESRSKRDASVSTHDLMSTSDFYKNLFKAWKRSWISATDAVDFSAAAFASLCSIESPSKSEG